MHTITKRTTQTIWTRVALAGLLFAGLVTSGCETTSRTRDGAILGAGSGAVLGGAIAKATGKSAKKGAAIGAAAGAVTGGLIGRRLDQQAKELEEQLRDAEVERTEEGIAVRFDSAILFDFDSSSLRGNARSDLSELAYSIQSYPGTKIVVVGHTDAIGSDAYNQRLSERRADAVRYELQREGVTSSRLTAYGVGESQPVASNASEYGRAQNRRVELTILADQ
ncbi:MAG: OmpA family protein [Bacteroidota bacterium]